MTDNPACPQCGTNDSVIRNNIDQLPPSTWVCTRCDFTFD